MSRKGFTLVELLTAIVIIALLSGIGIIGYQSFFKSAEERYYDVMESNIVLAGNDYFEDHREKLPIGSLYADVSLEELIGSKYIEEVTDTEGNKCTDGTVFAYRENNNFKYEVCLHCGSHASRGRFCEGELESRQIGITSQQVGGGDYNVLKSFNNQEYSKGKNVSVTFSMSRDYEVTKYVTTNTTGNNSPIECMAASNSCSIEIDKTGTYKVVAYNGDKEISSRYFSAKIAKGSSDFRLEGETKYIIDKTSCSKNINTKKVVINIIKEKNEEYKLGTYRINSGEYKEPRVIKMEEN